MAREAASSDLLKTSKLTVLRHRDRIIHIESPPGGGQILTECNINSSRVLCWPNGAKGCTSKRVLNS